MDLRRVCRQWLGVLVGVLACLAVAQGQTVYTQGENLRVGSMTSGTGDASIGHNVAIGNDLDVDNNIDAGWCIYAHATVTDAVVTDVVVGEATSEFYEDSETISELDQRLKTIRRLPWKGVANGEKETSVYSAVHDLARTG